MAAVFTRSSLDVDQASGQALSKDDARGCESWTPDDRRRLTPDFGISLPKRGSRTLYRMTEILRAFGDVAMDCGRCTPWTQTILCLESMLCSSSTAYDTLSIERILRQSPQPFATALPTHQTTSGTCIRDRYLRTAAGEYRLVSLAPELPATSTTARR
jgi:hypothetical protein